VIVVASNDASRLGRSPVVPVPAPRDAETGTLSIEPEGGTWREHTDIRSTDAQAPTARPGA
jgi:hypothetical protein